MMSTALTVAQLPHSGGVEPSGTGYRPDSGEDVKGLFEMFKYSKLAAVALIAIAAASGNVRAEDAPADPVIAKRLGLTRQWLHARELAFEHPTMGGEVRVTSEYPDDLARALATLRG